MRSELARLALVAVLAFLSVLVLGLLGSWSAADTAPTEPVARVQSADVVQELHGVPSVNTGAPVLMRGSAAPAG